MRFRKRKKSKYGKIKFDADSAFIDSKNLASFDTERFDGVIEKPIEQKNFTAILIFFTIVILVFSVKTYNYQIVNGAKYTKKALANFTRSAVLFSDRGVVFDRFGTELIWNEKNENADFPKRVYIDKVGFSHILGFLSYPQTDKSGNYFEKEYKGKGGVEKYFNNQLNGKLGEKIVEINANGKVISNNTVNYPIAGQNLDLSIDAFLQNKMAVAIQNYIKRYDFIGGAGAMMDIENGEILAMVSLPEYSSEVMTNGKDKKKIAKYIFDEAKPFLNKTLYGEYTPGSIVKPFVAMVALDEKIVTADEKIKTNGRLVIPNKYFPSKPSIFRDWKNQGTVNIKQAIANSSNVFFYILGGGVNGVKYYQNRKGLGIEKLDKNYRLFGFGEKTNIQKFAEKKGQIPTPEWKKVAFADARPWNIGNTYYTSIGQFGFLVTPMQALVAVSAIANGGNILEPVVVKDARKKVKRRLKFSQNTFRTVKEGMRMTTTDGTTRTLNFDFVKIAAKSGSAQIKRKTRENSWVIGFFPYEKPKYAFVFLAEDGPKTTTRGVSNAAREFFLEISNDKKAAKEYLGLEIMEKKDEKEEK